MVDKINKLLALLIERTKNRSIYWTSHSSYFAADIFGIGSIQMWKSFSDEGLWFWKREVSIIQCQLSGFILEAKSIKEKNDSYPHDFDYKLLAELYDQVSENHIVHRKEYLDQLITTLEDLGKNPPIAQIIPGGKTEING